MQIKGKTAIVTGGAIRIGKAIALALARKGAHVIITYNSSKRAAQETLNQIKSFGVEAMAIKTDVSKINQVKKLVRKAVKTYGFIDILVNNAAIFYKTPFEDILEKDWDSHIDINLKGTFNCSHQVGLQMLKQKGGKIINIADWAGLRPYKNYLPYCISKAGVICLTQGLARTLAPNVQVNAVAPGPVLLPPDFDEKEKHQIVEGTPLRKIGSPEDVANTVLFLIEGSDFITGSVYHVDGGRSIA